MFEGQGGALIDLLMGGVFLTVAFTKRWRGVLTRLSPYNDERLTALLAAAIGLIELYVGITQLTGGR